MASLVSGRVNGSSPRLPVRVPRGAWACSAPHSAIGSRDPPRWVLDRKWVELELAVSIPQRLKLRLCRLGLASSTHAPNTSHEGLFPFSFFIFSLLHGCHCNANVRFSPSSGAEQGSSKTSVIDRNRCGGQRSLSGFTSSRATAHSTRAQQLAHEQAHQRTMEVRPGNIAT